GAAFAACPKRTRTMGGGGVWNAGGTGLVLSSSFPGPFTWDVSGNNTSATSANLTAFAICAKLKGQVTIFGFATLIGGGQTGVPIDCPAPKVPISGGVLVDSTDTLLSLNATTFTDTGWISYVNNDSDFGVNVTPMLICGGT